MFNNFVGNWSKFLAKPGPRSVLVVAKSITRVTQKRADVVVREQRAGTFAKDNVYAAIEGHNLPLRMFFKAKLKR